MKDIKSLYQSAKSTGSKADTDAYVEAVNDCLQNNPYQYASNIEYIISSSYGIKTFKEFFDRYGFPLIGYDRIMESVDEAINKCSYMNIKPDIYNETKEMLESFRSKYENAFIMFESFNYETNVPYDEYLRLYYKEQFKNNVPGMITKFGEAAIPDIILEAERIDKVERTFKFLSEAITSDNSPVYYQWLSEVASDLEFSSDEFDGMKKKFTEQSLDEIVNSIQLRNTILYKESVLMNEHRNLEYSAEEVQVMQDFIAFKEYYMTAIDDVDKIQSMQNKIASVYEEFDGIIPEDESCADIVEMLPSTTVDKTVLGKQFVGVESTENKRTGRPPDYLKNNHDLSYGEDDDPPKGDTSDKSKLSNSEEDDLLPPSEFLRKKPEVATLVDDDNDAENDIKKDDKKDDKKNDNKEDKKDDKSGNDPKGPVNNYYYTYNNSFNKHRNLHDDHSSHSDNHATDNSLKYNSEVKKESVDMFALDIFHESADNTDEPVDPEKPTSDHPVRDTFMDIDRKLTKTQQEVKKTVQSGVNAGKAFIKPAQRTAGWISSMVNQWKDTNENNVKEKMADPRARSGLYQAIRKAIAAGSLFKAGLLLNPIFLFLSITKKVTNHKNSFRIRNEMIGEIKAELAIIDEKIKDAEYNRDNGAKYKLMRIKNEMTKKLIRVDGGKKMSKII